MIEYNIPVTIPASNFKTVSGVIPRTRFTTLYSNPFVILPAPLTEVTYIPITFTINFRYNVAPSANHYILGNFAAIDNYLPNLHGAYCVLRNPSRSGVTSQWYTFGVYNNINGDENYKLSQPIIFMTEANDAGGNNMQDCPYSFSYYEYSL